MSDGARSPLTHLAKRSGIFCDTSPESQGVGYQFERHERRARIRARNTGGKVRRESESAVISRIAQNDNGRRTALLANSQTLVHQRRADTGSLALSIYGQRRKSCRRDSPIVRDDGKVTEHRAADDATVEVSNQGYQDVPLVSKPFDESCFRATTECVGDQLANSGRIGVSFDSYDHGQRSPSAARIWIRAFECCHDMELDRSTELAYERTWLAEERTMQAWVRTATSLISFGFGIYSFFALQSGGGHHLATHWGPPVFSILLIAMGLATLLGAVVQRRQAIKVIEARCPSAKRFSLAEVIAIALGGIGMFGLIAILLRK